jgi:hypothetical protein
MQGITREEGCEILAKVYGGECGNHASFQKGCQFHVIELVKTLQDMSVPCQADSHANTGTTNDPALMALRCVGAKHHGAISPRRRRVPIPLCRHRQVHQVAGSNPNGQNQQAIRSEVHQIHHM